MLFYNLKNTKYQVSFRQAVLQSIAPDEGLFFPSKIISIPELSFPEKYELEELAYLALAPFAIEDIDKSALEKIIKETLAFPFPLHALDENTFSLELFHGPTLAFKDVGARCMARCLAYFQRNESTSKTVLVATSGDTGGAVANGFLGVEGVRVVILYPKGGVSPFQEKQLTTLGQNIAAIEVNGTFDDCQTMVKRAFLDTDLSHAHLTSANSINVARWLPQMFYYLQAKRILHEKGKKTVFSIPSGNFGNICAGLLAKSMGLEIDHFVAATNHNDTVPRYMNTGKYEPAPSKASISNAMDVGNPSNFVRILEMFRQKSLSEVFSSYSFSDAETVEKMKYIYERYKYVLDPHGAVGLLGLEQYGRLHHGFTGVFLETAHPIKFQEVVENALGLHLDMNEDVIKLMNKPSQKESIGSYDQLKEKLTYM